MDSLLASTPFASAVALVLTWVIPRFALNARPLIARQCITGLVAAQCIAAGLGLASWLAGSIGSVITLQLAAWGPLSIGLRYDGVSAVTLLLVSFVGLAVCKYSIRYLDGDDRQGDYFRWVGATIGAVCLAVLASNLLWLVVAWVAGSMSLHRLLLHIPHRTGAQRAAWTKFGISRLGDLFLLSALALLYTAFGSLDLDRLFANFLNAESFSPETARTVLWANTLLVLGAATKSAQFPLHSWLPMTLETPTPVSALMHAGVVNAGGYLIIRVSPLVAQSPSALAVLALIGSATVFVGGLAMMTQSSVKQMLAYSTVAQMGFMMLQCGLGAFAAAMLHIVAHSLYKAYAFLNSGSVLSEARATAESDTRGSQSAPTWAAVLPVAAGVSLGFMGVAGLLGLELAGKSGGFALPAIICMALTLGVLEVLATRRRDAAGVALLASVAVAGLYTLALGSVSAIVNADVASVQPNSITPAVGAAVVAVFLTLFLIQASLRLGITRRWLEPAYVHAVNGFYIHSLKRRAFGPLATRR